MKDLMVKSSEMLKKLPRYARINTLKHSLHEAVESLSSFGWQAEKLNGAINWNVLQTLSYPILLIDPDIDDLLIFPHGTDLHNLPDVLDGRLILQDKVNAFI